MHNNNTLGEEIGVDRVYISMFDRGKHVPEYARIKIQNWIDTHPEIPNSLKEQAD